MNAIFSESFGRGSDVVLLHGWALHGGIWRRVADALATDFCVHCPDLPGHGRSDALDATDLAAWLAAVRAAFPLPVHVVGWSLGGLMAQAWARFFPDEVKSLTLVSSSPCFVQKNDWAFAQKAEDLAQMAANLQTDFAPTLQRFLMLQTLGSNEARQVLRQLQGELFAHGEAAGLLPALAMMEQEDARDLAAHIEVPTLVVAGARDSLTPLGASRWLAENIAGAQLLTFQDAAHTPFLSHEAEFCAALLRFLQEND